jgi:hypothetical protein
MIPPQAATELTAQHLVLVAQHGQFGVLGQRHAPVPHAGLSVAMSLTGSPRCPRRSRRSWAGRQFPQVDGLIDGGRQRLRRGLRVIETMIWP